MLSTGSRLGPYEIVAPLGSGGMGEVYRARDTRLGREVAIKVLPMHLSAEPEVRARFEREAKIVSSLNHPNICTLFDVGRVPGEAGAGETDFLVMELVEGETLADRLKRGPLPPAELLRFGTQIADALDRAHRAGVIHRDLKPANVMITRSGAKLMDFGLSRAGGVTAGGASGAVAGLTQSPTIARALTSEGTLLGTFQYMSPEQLEGREADARSDIWAFGCVLYEMATGRRAFDGRSQASLIAAILEREPAAIGEAPSGSPSLGGPPHGLERLIRNCLAKEPDERIQTAHDVKLHLQAIAEGAGISATGASSSVASAARPALSARSGESRIAWAIAALALVAAAGVTAWLWPLAHAKAAPIRFRIGSIPHVSEMFWPRVSPDGRQLLFVAPDSSGNPRTYLRPLNEIEARAIPGTEGANRVYWSPDSREVAFVVGDKMQRVSIAGSSPTLICAANGGADLSWGSNGLILMDGHANDSLRVVPAGGGELKPASRIDRAGGETTCAWPCFLPDGEHFLFIGGTASNGGNIRLGRIGSLESKKLGQSDGRVEYAPGGWVLYVKGTSLLAQKLDLGAAKLTGEPITIVDDLRTGQSEGHFSVSNNGILALARIAGGDQYGIQIGDRRGLRSGDALVSGTIVNPEPSPDGRFVLYQRRGGIFGREGEIFVYDTARSTDTRLTFTNGHASTPVWAPDGHRFAYATHVVLGDTQFRIASSDGLGAVDSISLPKGFNASLSQWSAAGSRLLFFTTVFRTWILPAEGTNRVPRPLADSSATQAHGEISPDGRWLAVTIANGTAPQIFVESLGEPPGRWQISTTTGILPRWTRGGKELVYESLEGNLMAAEIDTKTGFQAGTPQKLFTLPSRSFDPSARGWNCDAAGERFFLVVPEQNQTAGILEVNTDFQSLVTRK
jgi:serine/threonine protein kinase/Tol biopolymer transport system component